MTTAVKSKIAKKKAAPKLEVIKTTDQDRAHKVLLKLVKPSKAMKLAQMKLKRFHKAVNDIKARHSDAEIMSNHCHIDLFLLYKLPESGRLILNVINAGIVAQLATALSDLQNNAYRRDGDESRIDFDLDGSDSLTIEYDMLLTNLYKLENHREMQYCSQFFRYIESIPFLDAVAKEAWESKQQLAFKSIPHLLKVGTTVGINTGAGIQAGQIKQIKFETGYFRPNSWAITLNIYRQDMKNYTMAAVTHRVYQYSGLESLDNLEIFLLTDAQQMDLVERGRLYVAITEKPSYMQYSGELTRKDWMFANLFRAAGRVMCDLVSMQAFDPDYNKYYGGRYRDYDGDENAKVVSFTAAEMLKDKEKILALPPFVYGFSFLCKQWGEMEVRKIAPIVFRDDAFERLVLDEDKKQVVHSLVKQSNVSSNKTDIIDNKGGGCIFLLHGKPGVGKTLTAEAIAEKLQRPLYMVGAGELGTNPQELEETLKKILDVVYSWNGILLIDEADIFLEKRTEQDIIRNAMVGIFLRMLEYYQGILFLTTNRVQDIDEAFYSRVSLGLHYEDLGNGARQQIWKNLADIMEIKDLDYAALAHHDINGRQIKNCLRLAKAIAAEQGKVATTEAILSIIDLTSEFKKELEKKV